MSSRKRSSAGLRWMTACGYGGRQPAHLGPANTGNFLEGFRGEQSGIHIALFHGAERSWFGEQDTGKQPHAAFNASEVEAAGLAHAFLGHYHRPKDAEFHTYPGNPDPLAFGEDGERGAVVATIGPDGRVARERHRVAVAEVHDLELNVTGLTTQQQILDRLEAGASSLSGFARLTVRGEHRPDHRHPGRATCATD